MRGLVGVDLLGRRHDGLLDDQAAPRPGDEVARHAKALVVRPARLAAAVEDVEEDVGLAVTAHDAGGRAEEGARVGRVANQELAVKALEPVLAEDGLHPLVRDGLEVAGHDDPAAHYGPDAVELGARQQGPAECGDVGHGRG